MRSTEDVEALMKNLKMLREKPCITIYQGAACCSAGSEKVTRAFIDEIERCGLKDKVEIKTTGCHGFCEQEPIVVMQPQGMFYAKVKPEEVTKIISEPIRGITAEEFKR